jgi:hypothetical protein
MGNHRKELIHTEPASGFQINVQPLVEGEEPSTASKFHSPAGSGPATAGEPGELPRTYGASTIYLVAQDPHRLFTYWDLDIVNHPGGPAVIRCYTGDPENLEVEFEVPFEARNWYIPVQQAGAPYRVEIGFYRSGSWNILATSEVVPTPPDAITSDESFTFATLPLDTAFTALLSSLPPQIRHHPELMRHLARLQKQQGTAVPQNATAAAHNEEAMQLLQSLLGDALVLQLLSGSWDSAALSSAIQAKLEESLGSEESSALLARFEEAAGEASLFSGLVQFPSPGAGAWSSEVFSSWTESLLSWAQAARHAAASEWLAGWQMTPGGAASGEFSSSVPAASSWFQLFASSWEKAGGGVFPAQSSWTGESLSSWASSGLSSWVGESLSSWTAESLSSWTKELLSSWASAESGSWPTAPSGREFFMHVNAELIFYGGTDPRASLTVDGQPVPLQPDGTFHYHFVFPDGEYEIPIMAVAPDGLETRKAVLRFHRDTAREGQVDATGQPPLAAPLGRI